MRCEQWREILSAQLDGEETPAQRVAVNGHLEACADCRRWRDLATEVTRRTRTRLVTSLPELTDVILASAPPKRQRRWGAAARWRTVVALRAVLGVLGTAQVVLGLAQVGGGAAGGHLPAGGAHLWHESAAWNVAVGAGFVVVAVRRSAAAGTVPLLTAFVAMLGLLSVNDLVTSQVAVPRLASHAFLLAGYAITVLLSRPELRGGEPPASRQQAGSRWRMRLDDADEPAPPRLVPPPHSASSADRGAA
ncbi:zf-HC2 domain-containing protein [Micromonospora sediminicola]|uniref:zf-HC2 domain-containing protein n=1 Tax=Micromonospora sediminicola TaxID=946078 RepID=UPI0037BA3D5D